MAHGEILSKEMKVLHFLFEWFDFYRRFVYVGSVDYLSTRTIMSLSKWCKLLYMLLDMMLDMLHMLLDMMLDKICDFLIGVFFFYGIIALSHCCWTGLDDLSFLFLVFISCSVVIVCRRVFVMLLQQNNVFSCGGVMDKNLGLNVLVESLEKGGKFSTVKTVVALYLLVFIGIVRLKCLMALVIVLLSFVFPSSTRWWQSL